MSIVFQSKIGAVVRFDDPGVQCTTQLMGLAEDASITFEEERSIITRMTLAQQVNIQFLHSLGALIYVYVFGDRMGQIGLSGLSFTCQCDGDASGNKVGAEQMLLWYKRNRASRRRTPIKLTIGNAYILEGFVTTFSEDVVDPSTNLVQWNVNMAALPEDDAPPAASGGGVAGGGAAGPPPSPGSGGSGTGSGGGSPGAGGLGSAGNPFPAAGSPANPGVMS